MNRRNLFIAIWAVLVCNCSNLLAQTGHFTYQNPIRSGIDPKGLRDCQVLHEQGVWYMTGTAFPHWSRQETRCAPL
mgnify:FL=1